MLQSNEIIHILKNKDSKSFVINHIGEDVANLSLRYSGKVDLNLTACLQLIQIYSKCRSKLPTFVGLGITDKSYQQATSEKVAEFKAQLYSGHRLIDACGGLGVDDLYFSKYFDQVLSYDTDVELNKLVRFNLELLQIDNIDRVDGSIIPEEVLGQDVVYLDPDRRIKDRRVIRLEDMEPNILEIVEGLPSKTKVLLKLSPLFEVKQLLAELKGVEKIFAISEGNEVKELFVELVKDSKVQDCSLHAVEVGKYHFHYRHDVSAWEIKPPISGRVNSYLYIPKSSLNKLHLSSAYAEQQEMQQLEEFEIYHSDVLNHTNEMRTYRVLATSDLTSKKLARSLKEWQLDKAELIVKGHSESSEKWYKKLKLKAGGNKVLFLLFGKVTKAILCDAL